MNQTVEVKTSELTGAALDWAVAKADGHEPIVTPFKNSKGHALYLAEWAQREGIRWQPSTDWWQGGPIIERECICTYASGACSVAPKNPDYWVAEIMDTSGMVTQYGPTPLSAAMRCRVASEMGDTVQVPKELLA